MDNTILIRGRAEEEGFIASEALTPGELVEFGGSDDIQAQSSAADTSAQKMWVREQQENQGAGIDDDVAASDEATVLFPHAGAKIQAFLAHGANVSVGDALEADGAGALQAFTSGRVLAYAAEALNNTSGSASRIDVYVA